MQDIANKKWKPKQVKQKHKCEIFKCDDLHDRVVVDVLRGTEEHFKKDRENMEKF